MPGGEALLAAVLAGTAAALWVRSPAGQVTRARHSQDAAMATPGQHRLLQGRPDAASPRTRLAVSATAALGVGLALHQLGGVFTVVGWLVMPLFAAASVVVLGQLEPARSRQRAARLVLDLPQALELLSACLAAGMPLRRATAAVAEAFEGPVAEDLGSVVRQVDLGISDAEAWSTLRGSLQWSAAAVDLARSVESGTMMVEVLVHHAQAARQLRRAALEVRAKAVGVRSVLPLMTCFLPAFMLIGVVPTVASAVMKALF